MRRRHARLATPGHRSFRRAARGGVRTVDRRQHRRRVDALGARAARVRHHVGPQRRHAARRAPQAVLRCDRAPIRRRATSWTGSTPRRCVPNTAAASARSGVEHLARFIAEGGTLVTLGAASDLAIDRLPVPVRNLKRGMRRELHSAPGTILRLQVDTSQPLGYGVAEDTYGFYTNGPLLRPDRRLHVTEDDRARALPGDGRRSPPDGCAARN